MLFHSATFLFGFLPLTLLGFFLAARWRQDVALGWLLLASLSFYAAWDARWLPLLIGSIVLNLLAGRAIARQAGQPAAGRLLALAIVANLAVLGHYKYAGFGLSILADAGLWPWPVPKVDLPMGISFFTFTQIAFLVDVFRREAHDFNPLRYGLFVTYYPHLIAGPILHHQQMMPQFARADVFRFDAKRLADGLTLFLLGLFKKVVLADTFGGYAAGAFAAAALPEPAALSLFEAWAAALSYTLQIYFDFSGYSDMAIALAAMTGVQLPMNFDAPYQSRNIAEFWRRWHMTLSTFLRDYLYIPLGGNRRGLARQQLNLMVTMLLGGLWHGAGWTYVVWGGLHGLYLTIYHAWARLLAQRPSLAPLQALTRWIGWPLTFLAVVVAWVFFRAENLGAALAVLRGMAGLNGAVLPDQILAFVPPLRHVADGVGKVRHLADGTVMGCVELGLMLTAGLALVRWGRTLPNLSRPVRMALLLPCAALALQRVVYGQSSPFLYFQF